MSKSVTKDYYQALLTRDPKFDGKFFSGVKTTGIYCRPICPAKPKRENVVFFRTALQAEKAGYRPCLRCRPESAPDSPVWHGTSSVVKRAVRVVLSDENAINLNEDELALRFGLSARHLRRLFQEELGKTPFQIMRNNRLNIARKLIVESDLNFVDIAFSAGFNSVRRFNDAIRERFSKSPSELRRRKNKKGDGSVIHFTASYRPPLDWHACLKFYEKHKIGELEQFHNNCYHRVFRFEKDIGTVTVSNNKLKHQLEIALQVDNINAISFVLNRVKEMFDLDLDPVYVANIFEADPLFKKLYQPHHGVRLIRCWDRFEMAITAILGQLISVKRATQLTFELINSYGESTINPYGEEAICFFPTAEKLAKSKLKDLKVTGTKKIAITQLAKKVASGDIHFSNYQDPEEFKTQLLNIHGIGHWTAEYIALRAIGDTDAFPEGDVYLNKILGAKDINCLSPWRGYLATTLYKYGGTL